MSRQVQVPRTHHLPTVSANHTGPLSQAKPDIHTLNQIYQGPQSKPNLSRTPFGPVAPTLGRLCFADAFSPTQSSPQKCSLLPWLAQTLLTKRLRNVPPGAGRPAGNQRAPPQRTLRGQRVAPARGIGSRGRDVAWAGRVGLRQRRGVPARSSEGNPRRGSRTGPCARSPPARELSCRPARPSLGTESRAGVDAGPAAPSAAGTLQRAGGRAAGGAEVWPAGAGRARAPRQGGQSVRGGGGILRPEREESGGR